MAGLVVSGTQVSYIGQDCREIPEQLSRDYGHFAKRLDLSFNLLSCCSWTFNLPLPRRKSNNYPVLDVKRKPMNEGGGSPVYWGVDLSHQILTKGADSLHFL
ncbi:hypothetical protein LEMLEM_LOCUS5942, partial [Lemmus lemmus]